MCEKDVFLQGKSIPKEKTNQIKIVQKPVLGFLTGSDWM